MVLSEEWNLGIMDEIGSGTLANVPNIKPRVLEEEGTEDAI